MVLQRSLERVPEKEERPSPKEEVLPQVSCRFGDHCRFLHQPAPDAGANAAVINKPASPATCGILQQQPRNKISDEDEALWVLDTGTSIDVSGETSGPAIACDLPALRTGGGIVKPKCIRQFEVPELGETVKAAILKGSPNALAIGKRCALKGFSFYWRPWHSIPEFVTPDNRLVS